MDSANFDSPWKEIFDDYLPDFMRLFFPEVYQDIDWSRKPEPLEQELREIAVGSEFKKNFVDKLYKVWRKDNQEQLIHIHIEIQSQRDKDMPWRMYIYHCKLVSKQKIPLVGFIVLGDNNPQWRPEEYSSELWGYSVQLKFPVIKLLDYKDKLDEISAHENPFVYFVKAHLKTLETTGDMRQRLGYKQSITEELLVMGLPEKTAIDLIRFIDAVMTLPKNDEVEFIQNIRAFQEEKKMPFLAPFEIIAMEEGMEKGLEKGLLKGRQEGIHIGEQTGSLNEARISLMDILEEEFGAVPALVLESIHRLDDLDTVRRLRRQALKASSIEEFDKMLVNALNSGGNTN